MDVMCNIETIGELKINSNLTPDIKNAFISKIRENQNKAFEYALRNVAIPPIKGEITKGKPKWRGIRIVQRRQQLLYETWLEQRGVRISAIFQLTSGNNNQIK